MPSAVAGKTTNVLFLCTGNSARSLMAEAILAREGAGRFTAHSAGSQPTGHVHSYARDLLRAFGHPTESLRSKSWAEFAGEDAPRMDIVITVCDSAAGEVCPVWPGQPVTAHWSFADPAAFEGSEAETRAFFARIYGEIHARVGLLVNLPIAALDRPALADRLDDIGRHPPA